MRVLYPWISLCISRDNGCGLYTTMATALESVDNPTFYTTLSIGLYMSYPPVIHTSKRCKYLNIERCIM